MKKDTFLEILSDIDDDLIEEGEKATRKGRKIRMRYMATAACICIIIFGSVLGNIAIHVGEEKSEDTGKSVAEIYSGAVSKEDKLYDGYGTGEFVYNGRTYQIINNIDYLVSNNFPLQINKSDIGLNLANNVCDTAANNIGNVYAYNNSKDATVLVVQGLDGTYNLAIEK